MYKSNFSQNFLFNKYILSQMVNKIKFLCLPNINEYIVLEIGPGTGLLTHMLMKYLDHLYAVEIDVFLVKILKNKYSKFRLTLYNMDILKFNLSNFFSIYNKIFIVGNLPYHISKNMIFYFIKYIFCIKEIYCVLQKEFVYHIVSNINSKKYGMLTVLVNFIFDYVILCDISADCFYPKPKVNSIFIKLIPKNVIYDKNFYYRYKCLKYILHCSFIKRRKKIKNSLKHIITLKDFDELSLNCNMRPENIKLKYFLRIVDYIMIHKNLNLNNIRY